MRGGAGLSEIEIAVAVFLPGVTAQRRCMGPLNRFWHRTASIGPIVAPLIPQLGIASLRVAGSTVKSKKLGHGVEIELQGQPVQETSAGNSWRRSDLRRQIFGRFHGLYFFFVSCNTAAGVRVQEFVVLCRYDSRRLLLFLDESIATAPAKEEVLRNFTLGTRSCIPDQVIEEIMLAHLRKYLVNLRGILNVSSSGRGSWHVIVDSSTILDLWQHQCAL